METEKKGGSLLELLEGEKMEEMEMVLRKCSSEGDVSLAQIC